MTNKDFNHNTNKRKLTNKEFNEMLKASIAERYVFDPDHISYGVDEDGYEDNHFCRCGDLTNHPENDYVIIKGETMPTMSKDEWVERELKLVKRIALRSYLKDCVDPFINVVRNAAVMFGAANILAGFVVLIMHAMGYIEGPIENTQAAARVAVVNGIALLCLGFIAEVANVIRAKR
jgi:hypothetical protein